MALLLQTLKEFRAPTLLGYTTDRMEQIHNRARYLGPTILPSSTVDDLEFEYLRGYGEIPIMAEIVDFASPAKVGGRFSAMDRVRGELCTIKRKYDLNVKDALRIERMLASGAPDEYKQAVRTMYNDVDRVLGNLAARVEKLRWQALVNGTVTYSTPDIQFTLDYQRNAGNVAYTSTNWSTLATATPLTDLRTLCDEIGDRTGVRPTRAVCRRAVWEELLWNEAETKDWIHGRVLDDSGNQTFGTNRPVMDTELNGLLRQMGLPSFAFYDTVVGVEDPQTKARSTVPLIPANTIVLLPPAEVEVGRTLFGPTPSEVWNAGGYRDAIRQLSERPRYIVRIYKEGQDPGTVWTLGEATAVPAMPGIDYVGVLHTRTGP